jgi:hypothetical protein
MSDVRYKEVFLALLTKRARLLVCLSISLLTPKETFADSIDLEVVPGKGVVGYMEFGMSVEDLIALVERDVFILETNTYRYDTTTKEVKMASSIEIEDLGVKTVFSTFEYSGMKPSSRLVRKVLSIDIDLGKGRRRGRLVLKFLDRGRLVIEPTLIKDQIIKFMRESAGDNCIPFRHIVYGSNNELESLVFEKQRLFFGFTSNKLDRISVWTPDFIKEEKRAKGSPK